MKILFSGFFQGEKLFRTKRCPELKTISLKLCSRRWDSESREAVCVRVKWQMNTGMSQFNISTNLPLSTIVYALNQCARIRNKVLPRLLISWILSWLLVCSTMLSDKLESSQSSSKLKKLSQCFLLLPKLPQYTLYCTFMIDRANICTVDPQHANRFWFSNMSFKKVENVDFSKSEY